MKKQLNVGPKYGTNAKKTRIDVPLKIRNVAIIYINNVKSTKIKKKGLELIQRQITNRKKIKKYNIYCKKP